MKDHKISFMSAILMNINLMVGAGIYIGPTLMAQKAGSASFLGWPLAALLFLPVVWSIGQVAKLFPGQGSFYSYSNKVLGQTTGFVSGWLYFLGYVSIGSLQTLGLREVCINQFDSIWVANNPLLFNLIFIGIVCLINFFALGVVAKIQSTATILKLLPILLVLGIFMLYWNPALSLFDPQAISKLSLTIPVALFGFWGFEGCCNISHLIRGDSGSASRAVLIGFFTVVIIYSFFHLGILHIMGAETLAREGVPGFVEHLHLNSPLLGKMLNIAVFSSIALAYISAIYGGFIGNASLLHAMAEKDVMFASQHLRKTNRFERPWLCLLLHAATMLLFTTLITSKDSLNAMSNIGVLITFFLTFISLIIIQRKKKAYCNALITLAGFASCILLIGYSWELIGVDHMSRFMSLLPLLGITGLGIMGYIINKRSVKKLTD